MRRVGAAFIRRVGVGGVVCRLAHAAAREYQRVLRDEGVHRRGDGGHFGQRLFVRREDGRLDVEGVHDVGHVGIGRFHRRAGHFHVGRRDVARVAFVGAGGVEGVEVVVRRLQVGHELRGAHLLYRRGVVVGLQLVDDVAHGGGVFGVGQGRRVLRADGFEAACGCGGRVGVGVELGGLEVELQAAEEVVARVVFLHQRIGVDVLRRARVAGVFVGQGGGHALVVGEEVVFRGEFLRNGFDEFVEQVVVFRVAGLARVGNLRCDDLHNSTCF